MDGILIINKEKGYTSHDVVARLRGILHRKKIGHTGTLDPDATGVLPVCLGRATKVCDLLTETDKTYEAVMLLGVTTDTQDMSGTVLERREPETDEARIREVIASFRGPCQQIPPMYSALKVNGRKLVDLAREGKVVERKPRPVQIYDIEVRRVEPPRVWMRVHCSKGTYIRTLCHDVGQALGCGAAMEELVRTRAAGFTLEEALLLAEVEALQAEDRLGERLIPLERVFAHLPRFVIRKEREKALANGNPLRPEWGKMEAPPEGETAVCFPDGRFAAVYAWNRERGLLMPVKMFL